jgi:DNA-binding NtrC family response regulator
LNVVSLVLKPLRERPGDILPLIRHFIAEYSRRLGHGEVTLGTQAQRKLLDYSWPGNIRELENVIHHTLLICRNRVIGEQDLHLSNFRIERQDTPQDSAPQTAEALLEKAFVQLLEQAHGDVYEKVEAALLRTAYRYASCNQVHTASLLGLSRNVTRSLLIRIGELVVNRRRGALSTRDGRVVNLST